VTLVEGRKLSSGDERGAGQLFTLMRPRHWVKNLFVFAALLFAGKLLDGRAWLLSTLAFAGFCLLSSAAYVINDIADAEEDCVHPGKKSRPIASGQMSKLEGALLAGVCLAWGISLCVWVNLPLLIVGLLYVALNGLYTFFCKRWILVDVMCIAFGFVLRAVAGGVAIGVPVSLWLLACTFTLCMFLGFGKRRCEAGELGENEAAAHRATLSRYSPPLLDHLLSVSGGVAIVTYILYTLDPRTVEKLGTPYLFFSVPLVIYCIFRVALLVESERVSGPTEAVTRDRPFIAALLVWAAYAAIVVTWGRWIQGVLHGIFGTVLER